MRMRPAPIDSPIDYPIKTRKDFAGYKIPDPTLPGRTSELDAFFRGAKLTGQVGPAWDPPLNTGDDRVPRVGANDSGTAGGLHANGKCPGCELWLNENSLPPSPPPPPEEANKGVHMHPEDEIIFVTKGDIRLGNRVYEAGAALAVARDTFYGFHPGPSGLGFVTFRPSATNQIRFAAGGDDRSISLFDIAAADRSDMPNLRDDESAGRVDVRGDGLRKLATRRSGIRIGWRQMRECRGQRRRGTRGWFG